MYRPWRVLRSPGALCASRSGCSRTSTAAHAAMLIWRHHDERPRHLYTQDTQAHAKRPPHTLRGRNTYVQANPHFLSCTIIKVESQNCSWNRIAPRSSSANTRFSLYSVFAAHCVFEAPRWNILQHTRPQVHACLDKLFALRLMLCAFLALSRRLACAAATITSAKCSTHETSIGNDPTCQACSGDRRSGDFSMVYHDLASTSTIALVECSWGNPLRMVTKTRTDSARNGILHSQCRYILKRLFWKEQYYLNFDDRQWLPKRTLFSTTRRFLFNPNSIWRHLLHHSVWSGLGARREKKDK